MDTQYDGSSCKRVGGQPTDDRYSEHHPDGTEAYGERMRLTQNGDLYIHQKESTNALKTNKMYYIKSAPYTWMKVTIK